MFRSIVIFPSCILLVVYSLQKTTAELGDGNGDPNTSSASSDARCLDCMSKSNGIPQLKGYARQ
jgi:hypothetical protein